MKPLIQSLGAATVVVAFVVSAQAAPDKLGRVKAGRARETPMNEVAESIDGLQAASVAELRTHCGSLKQEREAAEKELEERIREARIAEGTLVDVKTVRPGTASGPARPLPTAASGAEASAAKKATSEAHARRTMLACQLYALGEIQGARAMKRTLTTKDIVKKCFEAKAMPAVKDLTCDDGKAERPSRR